MIFTENIKMADLILANSRLLYVLPYFGIGLGVGDKTVRQVCNEAGVSVPLLLLVCNIYTFDGYCPDNDELRQIPVEGIIGYLRNSHRDYLEVRMPRIIDDVRKLGDILASFCEKYRQEAIAHFKYEEEVVFPYIGRLLRGEKAGFNIGEYENNSDIDAALEDLKNIIIKYLPAECTIEMCRDVLLELFMFEYDLRKHTLLEDKILVSLVENIEKSRR